VLCLHTYVQLYRNALDKEMDADKTEVNKRIDGLEVEVRHIGEQLENTVIGDFRWPVFSALIILVGLIISLLPQLVPIKA